MPDDQSSIPTKPVKLPPEQPLRVPDSIAAAIPRDETKPSPPAESAGLNPGALFALGVDHHPNTSDGGSQGLPLTGTVLDAMLGIVHHEGAPPSWQPPTPEELQRDFPQYEIRGILGRGGMGAVYKAWQKSLDRFVAIKILPSGIEEGDVHYSERFKMEAKAMARLSHPGIVAVFDAGEMADGLLYFVMEFIEGTDVQKMIAQGPLPPEHALAITAHVCDALGFAHERGIVHRDIKPANIMVDARGHVKVADFGLAKVTTQDSGGFTGTNLTMGTPNYIAPEAMTSVATVDGRADLYAVGVMLYAMLTGEIPRGRFAPPSTRLAGLDPRFDAIVDKAMQADREQRYASALEMRAELEKVVPGFSPSDAANTTRSDPTQRRGLKPRTTLLAAAVVAMLIAGGRFVWKSGHADAPAPPAAPMTQTPAPEPGSAVTPLAPPKRFSASYPQPAQWIDATNEVGRRLVSAKAAVVEGETLRIVKSPCALPLADGREFHNAVVRMICSQRAFLFLRKAGTAYYSAHVGTDGSGSVEFKDTAQNATGNLKRESGIPRADFDLDAEHELVFAAHDDKLILWIDGVEKASLRDSTLPRGKIGFQLNAPDADGGKVRIRKIEYAELPEAPTAK